MSTPERAPIAVPITADGADATVLSWEEARSRLAEARFYWLATAHPSGRPHLRPVLAVWVGGSLCTTSNPAARKGRNLAGEPRCSVAVRSDDLDVVLEGHASPVVELATLERVADAYRSKYAWPVTVLDSAFSAPYGAPTAGPPPYQPFEIVPIEVFAFVTDGKLGPCSTRWRFEAALGVE